MYELKEKLKLKTTQIKFAEKVGITPEFFSEVQNGRSCSKVVAFAITKIYSSKLEIQDLFKVGG